MNFLRKVKLGLSCLCKSISDDEDFAMTEVKVDSFGYEVYGSGSFHFTVKKLSDGEHRIYIDSQPSYPPGRGTGSPETHRSGLETGQPYIDSWPPPKTLEEARIIAESWSHHTIRYMRTGRWDNLP